jgi:hypothetical protein
MQIQGFFAPLRMTTVAEGGAVYCLTTDCGLGWLSPLNDDGALYCLMTTATKLA